MNTSQEFGAWLAGLAADFEGSMYPERVFGMLHKRMANLTRADLENIRNALLLQVTKKPSAGAILGVSHPYIQRAGESAKNAKLGRLRDEGRLCLHCDNSGLVEAFRASERHGSTRRTTAFGCGFCDCCEMHGYRSMPMWNPNCPPDGWIRISIKDLSQHGKKAVDEGKSVQQILREIHAKTDF